MNRPSPRQVADARATLRADRKARSAERGQRVTHKADPVKKDRGRVRDNSYLAYPPNEHLDDKGRLNTTGLLAAADILLAVESGLIKPEAARSEARSEAEERMKRVVEAGKRALAILDTFSINPGDHEFNEAREGLRASLSQEGDGK